MTIGKVEVLPINPYEYVPHNFHRDERIWQESNCYVDLFIELLNQLGLDPTAGLAFTLTTDFEGDQWTFFKFPHSDLSAIYGVDIQELQIWRPLIDHSLEQVSMGRVVLMEADAFFLPDTKGTSYRSYPEKTTIGVQSIDLGGRKLGYFHGPSYFTLEGDDFDGIFHLGKYCSDGKLPLFVEIAKLDGIKRLTQAEMANIARGLIRIHLARRPATNPFTRYKEHFEKHMEWLKEGDLETYHKYSFATLRQCGSCFEYTAAFLRWLEKINPSGLGETAEKFESIANSAKTLMLKIARSVRTKKDFDFDYLLKSMEENWEMGIQELLDLCSRNTVTLPEIDTFVLYR